MPLPSKTKVLVCKETGMEEKGREREVGMGDEMEWD